MNNLVPMNGEEFTTEELQLFEKQYLESCKNLNLMMKQKKEIETKEKEIKELLGQAMDQYGIKSMDNDYIKVTRVAGSDGKTTINLDKLQEKEPKLFGELLEDYPKVSGKRKASIKFTLK